MSEEKLFEDNDLKLLNESQEIRKEILMSLRNKGYDNPEVTQTVLAVLKDMDGSVFTKTKIKTMDKANDALKDMAANSANILLKLRDYTTPNLNEEIEPPVIPDTQTFKEVPGIKHIGEETIGYNEFMSKMEN